MRGARTVALNLSSEIVEGCESLVWESGQAATISGRAAVGQVGLAAISGRDPGRQHKRPLARRRPSERLPRSRAATRAV